MVAILREGLPRIEQGPVTDRVQLDAGKERVRGAEETANRFKSNVYSTCLWIAACKLRWTPR